MEKILQSFSNYLDYFEEIRRRVYVLAAVFLVFFVTGFMYAGSILRTIISFFDLKDVSVVTTSPFQFLDLATKVGAYTGLMVCMPLLIYYMYDFLKDGLNNSEKKIFFILFPTGLILFVTGFAYCFALLYFYLNSVSIFNVAFGLKNVWDISSFLSQVILASICFGFVFQFPIILTLLIRIGLIRLELLQEKKVYAIAGIFVFVGFLPPPDIFSTFIEALPLVVLFQLTLWVNSFVNNVYGVRIETKV